MSSTADPNDPSRIERQSEEIRADMSATLDALERKLSPQQLVDRSLNIVKDHGGEFVTNLGTVAKQNPVPLVLTAVGLIWLIAANARGSNRSGYRTGEYDEYGTDDYGYEEMGLAGTEGAAAGGTSTYSGTSTYGTTSSSGGRMQNLKQRVQETASHLKERVQQTTSTARERLRASRERMHGSGDSFRSMGGNARGRINTLATQTRSQALHARDSFSTMLHEQPLAAGALGVVIGAVIGAALPATRAEDRMLGSARNRALQRAKQMGQEQYETLRQRANDMAEQVANRAQQAVSNAGQNRNQTGTDAGTIGSDTTDAGTVGASRESGSFRGESRPIGRA